MYFCRSYKRMHRWRMTRQTLDVSGDGSKVVSEPQGKNMPSEEKVSTEIKSAVVEMNAEHNTEKWLEAEHIDTGTSVCAQKKLVQEDISFNDDLFNRLSSLNSAEETKVSSPGGCDDWVQLKGSPNLRLVVASKRQANQILEIKIQK